MLIPVFYACQQSQAQVTSPDQPEMMVVKLGKGDADGFEKVREAFSSRNPGYDLDYRNNIRSVESHHSYRVVFIQQGWPQVKLTSGQSSEVTVGDIVLMQPGEGLGS